MISNKSPVSLLEKFPPTETLRKQTERNAHQSPFTQKNYPSETKNKDFLAKLKLVGLVFFYVAVIKHWIKPTWKGKDLLNFIIPNESSSLKAGREGTQSSFAWRQKLKQRPRRKATSAYWLAARALLSCFLIQLWTTCHRMLLTQCSGSSHINQYSRKCSTNISTGQSVGSSWEYILPCVSKLV